MPLINDILLDDKKKKKKRRSPWASIEDLLDVEKSDSKSELKTSTTVIQDFDSEVPDAFIEPLLSLEKNLDSDIPFVPKIDLKGAGLIEPGSNLVQKHGSNKPESAISSTQSEPGSNLVQTFEVDNFESEDETLITTVVADSKIDEIIEPGLNQVHKPGSNVRKSESSKAVIEPGSNLVQKHGSRQKAKTNRVQSFSEIDLNLVQRPGSNQVQKPGSIERDLYSLRGNNKIVFDHYAKILVEEESAQIFINYSDVVKHFSMPIESVKTVFKRLASKSLMISKSLSGGGPLARRTLQLPLDNRAATYRYLINADRIEPGLNLVQKPGSQPGSIVSSKLVSNINTNLLGVDEQNIESRKTNASTSIPEFLNADISSLVGFGVYKKHLMDLHNQKQFFTVQQMEDFIWKFNQYVSDSEKVRGVRSIPALFVTLARQLASGYDPLESIQTPEQKLLGELIERNKKALMELKRQKEESKALEFEIWFEKLNRQERDELAPPNSIVESGSDLQKRSLMGYFDKAIWNG